MHFRAWAASSRAVLSDGPGAVRDRSINLLHWRGGHPLSETVAAFEALRRAGKIRNWGVSNLDELSRAPGGGNCAANQVLYHPSSRGIEYELLPWCEKRGVAVTAYPTLSRRAQTAAQTPRR